MLIADPKRKELDVWLPVNDAITLTPGSRIKLFLNVQPLQPIRAVLSYASYSAEKRPDGTLAYLIKAYFPKGQHVPRIGFKGTAKLYGEKVSLFYYLMWKPLSAIRRTLGL